MKGEREEEKWEVRYDSPFHHHGVKWIYTPGTKLLRFVSSAKFSWEGVSLVVSVSGVSLDAAVGMSANSEERLQKGGVLSQSDWLTADRSKSSSGNRLRYNPDTSGRSDRLWQVSIEATGQKRGESSGLICKVRNCWRRFLILGIVWLAEDFSWNPWMSPLWWTPVVKMIEWLGGLRV